MAGLEYEPPIEKGQYPRSVPAVEEIKKWDWMSEVYLIISSTTFAAGDER